METMARLPSGVTTASDIARGWKVRTEKPGNGWPPLDCSAEALAVEYRLVPCCSTDGPLRSTVTTSPPLKRVTRARSPFTSVMPRGSWPISRSHRVWSVFTSMAVSVPTSGELSEVLFTTYRVLLSGVTARPMGSTPTDSWRISDQVPEPRLITDTLRLPRLET